MNRQQERKNAHLGHVLLFAGPHGAGKDTLAAQFSESHPGATRIVRHITRPPTPSEIDGQDYHFIDEARFLGMAAHGAFIEYAKYIGVMSGTSHTELTEKLQRSQFANLTSNFEDGLALHRKLGKRGLSSACFFISPVPEAVIRDGPDEYLEALRERLGSRRRPSDLIEGRLAKAAAYRDLYLANEEEAIYIDNSNGRLEEAGRAIAHAAFALTVEPAGVEPA